MTAWWYWLLFAVAVYACAQVGYMMWLERLDDRMANPRPERAPTPSLRRTVGR